MAKTDASVLQTGETGTRKYVFARLIHNDSQRSGETFVAINCSSFSKDLLESEIFGHTAGFLPGQLRKQKDFLRKQMVVLYF